MKEEGKQLILTQELGQKKPLLKPKTWNTLIVGDSADKNYNYIPKGYKIPEDVDYFHCTSNNTIYGTQIKEFPHCPTIMVCDMSSDIFSRKIDVSKFDLIYAMGAQKNMGPAGTTLVIVKDEILGKTGRNIPTMLDYTTHIKKACSIYLLIWLLFSNNTLSG